MLHSRLSNRPVPLAVTLVVAALLSACGGGSSGGSSGTADAASVGASSSTASTSTETASVSAASASTEAASTADTGTTALATAATASTNPVESNYATTEPLAEALSRKKFWESSISTVPVVTAVAQAVAKPVSGLVRIPTIGVDTVKAISLMPAITLASIPAAAVNTFAVARRMAANVADPSQVPAPSDIGAFREVCNYSHMSFDDPIVYPKQSGASHLHVFFGNTGTDANSTATSIATTGNSTCAGGTLNRTAYWIPAMIDTATSAPVAPSTSLFYYKTGYNGVTPSSVRAVPAGLRMISGSASNATPSGPFRYACVGNGPDQSWHQSIPNCIVGDDMVMELQFPQCWDGVNLDSPDHKSHMAYSQAPSGCPADHPVALPLISFEIHYRITATDSATKWRLSSDNYDKTLPAGYSGHGDWFGGWDRDVMAAFIRTCENMSLDCHAYLLGDGTTLY